MRLLNTVILCGAIALSASSASPASSASGATSTPRAPLLDVTIRWTGPGIPHISASNFASLGYGHGYAVARDRLCLLADRIVTLRGERSRWYGPEERALVGFMPTTNLNADLFHRVQLSDASIARAERALDPDIVELARGYAAGFNRYVREQPRQELQRRCQDAPIPQMIGTDVVRAMQAIGTIWQAAHVAPFASASVWGSEPRQAQAAEGPAPMSASLGSNAWAYGADVTGTGSAIVVANPHSFWRDHWLSMHQMHLTIPGEIDVAGADFLGLPLPVAGFNRDVAWTLEAPRTVTYFVLQRLAVQKGEAPAYTVDGERKPLTVRPIDLELKQADGSIVHESFPIAYSQLGPIYRLPERAGRPAGWYSVTDAGADNAQGLNQLLGMARAGDVSAFIRATEGNRGLGAHFIAGDRYGHVAYVEGGPLLDVTDETLETCRLEGEGVPFNVLDGTRSACSLRTPSGSPRTLAREGFPPLRGRGVIQNTNGSYRFSMYGRDVQGYSRLFGDVRDEPFNMRTRMSARRMGEIVADGQVSESEALAVVFDNRNYAAETWLDTLLLLACGQDRSAEPAGCETLRNWDRRNDGASRGVLLFGELWKRVGSMEGLFAEPPDSGDPFAVRALARTDSVRQSVAAALGEAVAALEAIGLSGAEPWGRILSARTQEGRIPLHGGSGEQGVLNVMEGGGLGRDGYERIVVGSDYLHLVQWQDGELVAHTLLAHGQSDDPRSAHYADQLEAFSDKQLIKFPFSSAEIRKAPSLQTLRLRETSDERESP